MLDAGTFLDHLETKAANRVRVDGASIWSAFAIAYPQLVTAVDSRSKLSELLTTLSAEGKLRLPKGGHGWDASAKPSIPKWVDLVGSKETSAKPRMDSIPWPPELRFASSLPSTVHLDTLLKIKNWLAHGGRNAEPVPIKERSLELFLDEKRLDRLLKTALFTEGHLSLDLLKCYQVYPPLTWKSPTTASTRTALILENMATFESFSRWNEQHGQYCACVYGAGITIHKAFSMFRSALAAISPDRIEYFGDLDGKGLSIPRQLSELTISSGLPAVIPALRWYCELIDIFDPNRVLKKDPGSYTSADVEWLPDSLRDRTVEIFRRGYRIPQELIGWKMLSIAPPRRSAEIQQ